MAENIQIFTQEQLLEKPKRTVYEESKKKYSKITKNKIFQYKLANTVYQCLVNESATIQNLPINTLGYPDLQVNLQENELFISLELVELTMKKIKRLMNSSFTESEILLFIVCPISVNTIVNTEFNQ